MRSFIRPTKSAFALATLILLATFDVASACIFHRPTVIDELRNADLVFRGTVVGYERIEAPTKRDTGTMSFVVTETLRGPSAQNCTITLTTQGNRLPERWVGGDQVIVGAQRDTTNSGTSGYTMSQRICGGSLPVFAETERSLGLTRDIFSIPAKDMPGKK